MGNQTDVRCNWFDRYKMQIKCTLRRSRFLLYAYVGGIYTRLYLYPLHLKKQERYLKTNFCMLANRACVIVHMCVN